LLTPSYKLSKSAAEEYFLTAVLRFNFAEPPPSVPPPIPPPQTNEKKDEFLSNQLKEKLLKLEEEKNNVINLEKKVAAERVSP